MGAIGLSAVCDCGISWSNSLTIYKSTNEIVHKSTCNTVSGWSNVTRLSGHRLYFIKKFSFFEDLFALANSVNPDEMAWTQHLLFTP